MALIMTGIGDRGDLKNERIGFSVSFDCNLKNFMIFRTSFNAEGFYNRSQAAYWLAPEEVKRGDRVVVCTKAGQDSFQQNSDGTKTYFRYWGLDRPIFTSPEQGVVLARVSDWSLSKSI